MKTKKSTGANGWVLQILAAVPLFALGFFMLSGSPSAVYIQEEVGAMPWMRITFAAFALMAGLLLLMPPGAWLGAFLGMLTTGALLLSYLRLGELVLPITFGGALGNDYGIIFFGSLITFVLCLAVFLIRKRESPIGKTTGALDSSRP